MSEPRFRIEGASDPITERGLRGGLGRGEFSGLEQVVAEDGTTGLLCDLPVFAEAVPMMKGDDALEVALVRERGKLKRALLKTWPFVMVIVIISIQLAASVMPAEGFIPIGIMAVLALVQGRHALPSWRRIRRASKASDQRSSAQLEQSLAGDLAADGLGGELSEVDQAMRRLRQQRDRLAARIEAERALGIEQQLDAVQSQMGTTTSPATASALQAEAASLQERLQALHGAEDTLAELESRLRTYDHQVASLKTLLAQRGGLEAADDSLIDEVRTLRRRVAAEAEARSFGRPLGPR